MARAERTDLAPSPAGHRLEGLVFAGPGVDRDAERRADPGLLPALLGDDGTRVLALRGGRLPLGEDGTLRLRLPEGADAGRLVVYLGRARDGADTPGAGPTAYLGVVEPADEATEPGWHSLRSVAAALAPAQASLAATLTALANWHGAHTHCPRCGTPTRPSQSGWTRTCPSDGSEHFPRTDPAVIMAVVDDADRILLARGTGFTATGMSVLAGFVEPGESLADAVVREVREEVGVEVDRVEYLGDQPWPFPTGLMIGFRAHARTSRLHLQAGEIESARWFDRQSLLEELGAGRLHISSRLSISRRLIEDWFGGPIEADDVPLRA